MRRQPTNVDGAQLAITLGLSAYLIWMFRHFRTTFTVHHPLEAQMQRNVSDYFAHPYGVTSYGLKICPFGQHAILALVAFLWVRVYVETTGGASAGAVKTTSRVVLAVTVLLSLMNMNAVLYLVPYFAYEGWRAARPTERIDANERSTLGSFMI